MLHSEQPYRELERAKQAIEDMRTSQSFSDIEDHWKAFLHHIERVWTKSMNHFGKSPKWSNWHGKYVQLRRKDQLLSYLINARGADEHTVSEITERKFGTVLLGAKPGKSVFINKVGFNLDGTPIIDIEGDAMIQFTPSTVKPVPVVNRGVTYGAPVSHLSRPINSESLVDIAERGFEFYKNFLEAAETYFVSSGSSR